MAQTLAAVVGGAGSLVAASGAIALAWKKRARWEPVEEDVPKLAQHVGGVLSAAAIAVTWYLATIAHSLTGTSLISLIVSLAIATVLGLIAYTLLVGSLVYDHQIATGPRSVKPIKIIGGFWLTAAAKKSLVSGKPRPTGVPDLVKGCAYLEQVWSKFSRALAKLSFQLAYIALTACGTWLLACAAILLSDALTTT